MKLEIQLDRSEGTYLAGETIRGKVIIHDPRYLGSKLRLIREWRIEGYGNPDKGSHVAITLEQPWGSRQEELPFSFVAPNGPFSYLGSVVNIDWYLRVEVNGLLHSAHAEVDFFIDPIAKMPEVDLGQLYRKPRENLHNLKDSRIGWGCFYVVAAFPYLGLIFAALVLKAPLEFTIPVGLFLTALYGFVGFHWYKKTLADMRLTEKNFRVSPLVLHRSENLEVNFSSRIAREVNIEKIELCLQQKEYAQSDSRKTRQSHEAVAYEEVFVLSEACTLQINQTLELTKVLNIPDMAAITFKSWDNAIVWYVELMITYSGQLHPSKYFQEITVLP
jgi:hypothetical protein